jgi:16S rRNA (cytosine967-C5)-methyltransferase
LPYPRNPKTDGARVRELARDILLRVEQAGAFASILLDQAEQRLSDRRDSALLHEMVLGVIRRQALLDHAISQASDRPPADLDPEVRIALRIGAYSLLFLDRVPDFAAVNVAVNLVKTVKRKRIAAAGGFVNAVLRRVAASGIDVLTAVTETDDDDPASLALSYSHPQWWVERIAARLGPARARTLLEANNQPADTVICVHSRRGTSDSIAASLLKEGVTVEACELPGALRVVDGSLAGSATLGSGDAWVQDEGSQLVSLLFGESVGPRVADLCAAPGGKTVQLAALLEPGGLIVACDRHLKRLRRLRELARRTGAESVVAVNADMSVRPPLGGLFNQVLVDAPCSGTGTLRRHPEIRWRLGVDDLKLLASRQGLLIRAGAALTAPGGSLVYSVCSVEPEEGEAVVDDFLAEHPEFSVVDPSDRLPPAYRDGVDATGYLRTWPDRGGLDGFFAAKMVRTT